MSPITIRESGLEFGPFDDTRCFHVERSALYAGLGEGVKMVEFILVKPGRGGVTNLLCVEAKSSAPRRETQPRFDTYFEEIRDKMLNALLLFLGMREGRHGPVAQVLPQELAQLDASTMGVRFVLVIAGAQDAWLPPLQDKMRHVLRSTVRVFKIDPASVAVLNERGARARGLIR